MARICDTVIMIEPVNFGFNYQTEESNSFQQKAYDISTEEIQVKALAEFRAFVKLLRDHGITGFHLSEQLVFYGPGWFAAHVSNGDRKPPGGTAQ